MVQAVATKLVVSGVSVLMTLAALSYVGSLNVHSHQAPACNVEPTVVGSLK